MYIEKIVLLKSCGTPKMFHGTPNFSVFAQQSIGIQSLTKVKLKINGCLF